VLRQIAHDRRFVAFSMIVPAVVIYMLSTFFDAVDNPIFEPKEFVPRGRVYRPLHHLCCARLCWCASAGTHWRGCSSAATARQHHRRVCDRLLVDRHAASLVV
jgi:hypothetical protein